MYGNHNGTNLAAYTQVDRKFFDRLNVSLGIRLESYTLDGTENISTYQRIKNGDTTSLPFQPVFRAGLNYRLTKSTFLRGSFGQGYRFPSVAEKYVTTSVGSLKLFSNPNLKPEYGWSSEIGIKQVLKIGQWKGYFDVAGFYTRYENMTEFTWGLYAPPGTPLNLNPGSPNNISNFMGFRAENAEEAQVSGFEIELAGGGKINKVEIFTLLGYTYMNPITLNSDSTYRATFSDSGTNVLKYRFKHLIKGDVQIDYKKISFGISVRYNSRMENVDKTFYNLQIPIVGTTAFLNLGDQLLPGFPSYRARFKGDALVFDMRLMLKITNTTRLGIIANNVFNQEYMGRPGDIQAPRNLAVQFSFNF
jgi:iron complex outermembrane receptor protein